MYAQKWEKLGNDYLFCLLPKFLFVIIHKQWSTTNGKPFTSKHFIIVILITGRLLIIPVGNQSANPHIILIREQLKNIQKADRFLLSFQVKKDDNSCQGVEPSSKIQSKILAEVMQGFIQPPATPPFARWHPTSLDRRGPLPIQVC